MVKASLVGSILGNVLLVMGAAMFVGGLKRERQTLRPHGGQHVQALLLLLAVVALVMPLSSSSCTGRPPRARRGAKRSSTGDLENMSIASRSCSSLTYVAGLLFSLRTHADLFNPPHEGGRHRRAPGRVRRAVIMLAIAGSRSA